jgi:hypothetical protein
MELSDIIKNNDPKNYDRSVVAVYRVILNMLMLLHADIDYLNEIDVVNNAVANALWCYQMPRSIQALLNTLITNTFKSTYADSQLETLITMIGDNDEFMNEFTTVYNNILNKCMLDDLRDNANSMVNYIGLHKIIPLDVNKCRATIENSLGKYMLKTLSKDKYIANLLLNIFKIYITPKIANNPTAECTSFTNDLCDRIRMCIQRNYPAFKQYINQPDVVVEELYIEFVESIIDRVIVICDGAADANKFINISTSQQTSVAKVTNMLESIEYEN